MCFHPAQHLVALMTNSNISESAAHIPTWKGTYTGHDDGCKMESDVQQQHLAELSAVGQLLVGAVQQEQLQQAVLAAAACKV